jgi:hypothetical protein
MPLLRFSYADGRLCAPDRDGRWVPGDYDPRTQSGILFDPARPDGPDALGDYVIARMDAIKAEGPIVFMVNGFEFDPIAALGETLDAQARSDNPHAIIFHFNERAPAVEASLHCAGWPLRLGFQPGDGDGNGLAVAFGWRSVNPADSHFEAYNAGIEAARILLLCVEAVSAQRPAADIHFFAHSLGTHVTLSMLAAAAEGASPAARRLSRAVLIGGSEFSGIAFTAYNALKEAQLLDRVSIYNVGNRRDQVTGWIGQAGTFGPMDTKDMICHHGLKPVGGVPLGSGQAGWIDLDLSNPAFQAWVQQKYGIALRDRLPGDRNHWVYFTDPGNTEFLKHLLRDGDGEVGLAALRQNAGIEGLIA